MSFVDNLVPTTEPDCTIDYHGEIMPHPVRIKPLIRGFMCSINETRGPWVAHLRKRSKVTVEPFIEKPRGII